MNIQRILDSKDSTEVFTMLSSTTLSALIKEACKRKIGALLLTDSNGKLTGIITERDILYQCNTDADFDKVTAEEIMTKNIIAATPEDDIHVAMDLMITRKIRHLPIISNGQTKGIITPRDLMHAMRQADKEEMMHFVSYLQTSLPGTAN